MSGIIGSKLNIRGSGLVGSSGTDGQHLLSSGAGKTNVFETIASTEYDDNQVQNNIALLGFKTAVNGDLAKYNLVDQIIDEFEDASGIDASASVNFILTSGVYGSSAAAETVTSNGGGGGGSKTSPQNVGLTGGSGGGGGQRDSGTSNAGGAQTNAGFSGGVGYHGGAQAGGGGGGATAVGQASLSTDHTRGGNGGAGATEGTTAVYDWTKADGSTATFNIDGVNVAYAGGGGGGSHEGDTYSGTATHGGGAGHSDTGDSGHDATAARGAGGGGGAVNGGAGSAGVVIFRYLTSAGTASGDANATGTTGSYNWAKFTDDGDFVLGFNVYLDILVLAGGGGGGGSDNANKGEGGGGGAGGFKYYSQRQSFAGTYGVVIGAGGSGGVGATDQGNNGGNSVLSIPASDLGITLQSTDTTASTANPDYGNMIVLMENAEGTATLNTDIKGYISEDSGVTFTQGTFVEEGTWGTNKKIIAFHDLDISAQSGSAMCWKITTHNQSGSKETKIHAVSIGWK